MASSPQGPDSLQPVLQDAEAELARRLQEACEAEEKGVASESAAEIRRLEDTLLAAAAAAKQTLAVRRRIEQSSEKEPVATEGTSAGTVREFTDAEGRVWRAWPVTPGQRTGRTKTFLGEFQVGWICFEHIEGSARRRLAGHPPRWSELSERDLDLLLQQAITVRERKPSSAANAPRPDR